MWKSKWKKQMCLRKKGRTEGPLLWITYVQLHYIMIQNDSAFHTYGESGASCHTFTLKEYFSPSRISRFFFFFVIFAIKMADFVVVISKNLWKNLRFIYNIYPNSICQGRFVNFIKFWYVVTKLSLQFRNTNNRQI